MKKIISFFVALLLLVSMGIGFLGCGNNNDEMQNDTEYNDGENGTNTNVHPIVGIWECCCGEATLDFRNNGTLVAQYCCCERVFYIWRINRNMLYFREAHWDDGDYDEVDFRIVGDFLTIDDETWIRRDDSNIDTNSNSNPPLLERTPLTPEQIFAYNVDAVFKIYASVGRYSWSGSGFFITSTGIAVTNHHVIAGANTAVAVLEDGREFNIVGYHSYDFENDIAIIQVEARGVRFQYTAIGNSDMLHIGEDVFTIGSPAGDRNTFFRAYYSRREPLLVFPSSVPHVHYNVYNALQIIAPIVGGNSGGAVFNTRGEVVGIVVAGNRERPHIAFAIPINTLDSRNVSVGRHNSLPLRLPTTAPTSLTYLGFPFVSTFDTISNNAEFIQGFSAEEMDDAISNHYSFVFLYSLQIQHISDINAYIIYLTQNGFQAQHERDDGSTYMIWLFNSQHNASLLLLYNYTSNILAVALGAGNAFSNLGNVQQPPTQQPPTQQSNIDPRLVGTWHTNMDLDLGYGLFNYDIFVTFNADGSGSERYVSGTWQETLSFSWTASGGRGTSAFLEGGASNIFNWSYTIAGNGLAIIYDDAPETPFIFDRMP
ncbi:MAG: S1C family serine protease [Oscillospiraceae bacterium]|nr:S1C family serine protease [Oscillospiraceae bacterium]